MKYTPNVVLGSITRFIISMREYSYVPTLNCIELDLSQHNLTWADLHANMKFVEGVFSAFDWSKGTEAVFWRYLFTTMKAAQAAPPVEASLPIEVVVIAAPAQPEPICVPAIAS